MSLAANLQLAPESVTPPKLDLDANFSAAGLTATTALIATDGGVGTTVTPEGLFTLYSSNDVTSTFHSVKTDGDVSLFLNNDSDINWVISLRGTNTDTLQIVNDSQQAEFAVEYPALSITTAGALGIGTSAPNAAAILDVVSNNSASASVRLYNTTTNVDMRMLAGTGEGTIGTASSTTLKIFANNTNAIYVGTDGHVGIGGASNGTYMLNVTGDINLTGEIYQGGSQTASWTDDGGGDIYRLSNVGVGINDPLYDVHVQDAGAASIAQIGVDTYNTSNLAYASELLLRRSNSDTGGTLAATVDTQTIGLITFHGVNSSNAFANTADISVVQSGAAGATYVASDIIFKTGTAAAAPIERMKLDSVGDLTITGNTLPAADSTHDLGTSLLRWQNLYVDTIGDTGQDLSIAATTTNLPSGHIFDYDNADVTITHSANTLTIAGGNTVVDSLTSGGNIVSDTDSTDDLGTSLVRWRALYADTLGDNGQALGIAATTLSFDTAATIDTSGSNQLDINTGTANTVITSGTVAVSNNFTVDTTTLHVDATNNNVGIGTATPNASYSLDVVGDINFSGNLYQGGVLFSGGGGGYWTQTVNDIYYNTGNVGIGNTGPNASYALDVTGDINFSGNLYQAGSLFSGGGGGSNNNTLLWPNYVSTSKDAHKVVFVDLNDGNYVWGWDEAKTLIRGTSWYALQGQPPVYGAFIIDASQNAIHWIDRRNSTLGPYMSFTVGTTNMAYGATISDIIFKDFKLYIVDNNVTGYGVTVIDFINDTSYLYTTSGVSKYNSNIGNRNNGNGYMLLSSLPAIRDNNVNVIDVIEEQGGNLDDDGRPLHYWAAGTDAGLSLYIPSNTGGIGNIYDSSDANNVYSVSFVGGSLMWSISDTNDKTLIREVYSTVAADAFTTDYSMDSTQTDWSQTFFNGSETLTDTVAYINSEGEEISLVGSDQGLSIHNLYGGEIAMTNTFVTPYMKGTRIAAYPLLDINDKSGNGYNFTGQASPPTFGTAGIYGNSANFDGTQYLLQTVSDFGPVSDFTISLMMKTNDNTLPVADEFLARLSDGVNHSLSLWATTSGGIDFNVYNSATVDSWVSNSVYDSQWHHIVFTRSGSTYYAYIDGVLVNTWVSTVSSATSLTSISIGSDNGGGQRFGGQIEQVFYGKTAYTSKEVADEYDRMQAALAGKNGLLTATDIDTIKVDPDSGYAIVTAGDTAHIMNANLGIIYDTDVVSAGTLNDADIKTMFGATEPHYFLAGSTSLEQVAPPTTGEGPANEAGGGASISSVFFLMGA